MFGGIPGHLLITLNIILPPSMFGHIFEIFHQYSEIVTSIAMLDSSGSISSGILTVSSPSSTDFHNDVMNSYRNVKDVAVYRIRDLEDTFTSHLRRHLGRVQ